MKSFAIRTGFIQARRSEFLLPDLRNEDIGRTVFEGKFPFLILLKLGEQIRKRKELLYQECSDLEFIHDPIEVRRRTGQSDIVFCDEADVGHESMSQDFSFRIPFPGEVAS